MKESAGFIYILYNKMYVACGECVFKVGKSKDITRRINDYTTCYLYPPEIKYLSPVVNNYSLAESVVFTKLKEYRLRTNRELFELRNLEAAIRTIENVIADINNDTLTTKERAARNPMQSDDFMSGWLSSVVLNRQTVIGTLCMLRFCVACSRLHHFSKR